MTTSSSKYLIVIDKHAAALHVKCQLQLQLHIVATNYRHSGGELLLRG